MSVWDDLVEQAATLVTAAAVVVATVVWLRTRSWAPAVPVLLELLLAAGVLRLAATDDWRTIAGAASIAVIRTTISTGLARSHGHPVPVTPAGATHGGAA